jgi:hypothetical protein
MTHKLTDEQMLEIKNSECEIIIKNDLKIVVSEDDAYL